MGTLVDRSPGPADFGATLRQPSCLLLVTSPAELARYLGVTAETPQSKLLQPETDMCSLDRLFGNSRAWASQHVEADPEFFGRLARQQMPRYRWIGCSDRRVPANEIVGLDPPGSGGTASGDHCREAGPVGARLIAIQVPNRGLRQRMHLGMSGGRKARPENLHQVVGEDAAAMHFVDLDRFAFHGHPP